MVLDNGLGKLRVGKREAGDGRCLAAVGVHEVCRDSRVKPFSGRRLDEHIEVTRLTSGERLPVSRSPRGDWPPVMLVQALGNIVDQFGRHGAKRGELPTHDGDETLLVLDDGMLSRDGIRVFRVGCANQGADACPGCLDIYRSQTGFGKQCVDRAQKVDYVVSVGVGGFRRPGELALRRSDVREAPPRNDEHDPAVERRDVRNRLAVPEPLAGDDNMNPFGSV